MPSDEPQTPKFYVTTPIYYVNARPHIGHAYTTIVADVLARRHRLQGDDTFFLTGTDEHGQKIERSAAAAGIPPQQFTDEVSAQFRSLWDRMGLTYNRYIRTTDPAHKQGAQQLFRELYNRGFIYLSTYTGSYCVSDEAFVDQPAGTPCPDCGRLLETVTEENFFFKLSEFQLPLLNLIESNELLITPDTARNEVLSFLRGDVRSAAEEEVVSGENPSSGYIRAKLLGKLRSTNRDYYLPGALKDLSVSRSSFTWGIPVPADVQNASGTTQNHVIYVWLDALANYMTAIGYGSDAPEAQAEFQRYWPADLHLVGKEITRFHCVYWPAFLLALNPKLQHDPKNKAPVLTPEEHADWAKMWVPKQITANGWLLFDNAKMSKSRGNIVRTETILEAFGDHVYGKQFPDSTKQERDLFAADVLRYFLLREIPFGQDGSFSFDALVTRYNADLANGYGNLVSRVLNMIHLYLGGLMPDRGSSGWTTAVNGEYIDANALLYLGHYARNTVEEFAQDLSAYRFEGALAEVWDVISAKDFIITSSEPWKMAKDPNRRDRLPGLLYEMAESIRIITLLLHPVLPNATTKVWRQLGLDEAELTTYVVQPTALLAWGGLQPGTKLGSLAPIFPRADKSLIQVMLNMEESRNTPNPLHFQESTAIPMVAEASLPVARIATTAGAEDKPSTDPAAAPRTATSDPIAETNAELTVGGSGSPTPSLPTTPGPHTSAPASGPFAAAAQTPATNNQEPATEHITIDDFMKVDLRVAQVTACERIPKADKLLRLEVDLGALGKRQILSGIAQHYTPEELLGRRIVVVSNLAPRKMRGLDSHGMLLAASEGPDGKPILATFGEEVALGSRVR